MSQPSDSQPTDGKSTTKAVDELGLWRTALDAFGAGLASAQRALAADRVFEGDRDDGGLSWPPKALPTGPVPPQFEAEARALLAQSDGLTKELLEAMDRNRVAPRRPMPRSGATSHARWSLDL